jgi:outer membrane protein assembly factor BamB
LPASPPGGRLNLAAALGTTTNRPFNDDFANRSRLVGSSLTARAAAQSSTHENGEPIHGGVAGTGSLWWTWTAPGGGSVTINTSGSTPDTVLAIYTGSALGALTSVASNDDASGSDHTSAVTFTAVAGTTYQIAVERKSGDGLVVVNLALLSSNDTFASAQLMTGPSWVVSGTTATASREPGEPHIKNNAGGHSVWYRWVAPATRRYYVGSFSSAFDTMIGVYTGTDVTALTEVTSATDGGASNIRLSSANVSFPATAGTTYYIAIDSEVSATGTFTTGAFTLNLIDSDWEFFGNGNVSTPAVASDGTLYNVDGLGHVTALNSDGSIKWTYLMLGSGTRSAPTVGSDGTIYIGDSFGILYALTPGGSRKWDFIIPTAPFFSISSSPALASDGTVYFSADDGHLYALNPDTGASKWSVNIGTGSFTTLASPTVAPDGTIYVGSGASKLYAITPAGAVKWTYATDLVYATPTIAADGTIYFGVSSPTNKFIALNPDGSVKWTFATGGLVSSSASIAPDGTIYFGGADKNLYALTPAGNLRWSLAVGNGIYDGTPAVASDGSIYIGCDDGLVYAVNADGTIRRTYATALLIRASPLLLNGRLYIGSYDYRFYSVNVGLVSATSAWPMHRQNPTRAGRAIAQPLAIGVQPLPQTILDGTSATFTVGATGSGTLTYQWRFNGTALAGATFATLTLDGATIANAGSYSVVVTDSSGSLTSSSATLTVTPVAPVIATQPLAVTVVEGSPATLSVFASGTAPLTYQWSLNGASIAGATSSTLKLAAAKLTDAGSYTVKVTNTVTTVTSQAAVLTVTPALAITNQPSAQTVADGANATFTVGAAGIGTLTYQWRFNATPISGATAATLTIPGATFSNVGLYSVIVTNSSGSLTSTAVTLAVTPVAPTVTTPPAALAVTAGEAATLTVTAKGSLPLSYQWSFNGTALAGATAATLALPSTLVANAGSYTVTVTNLAGAITSPAAALTVSPANPPRLINLSIFTTLGSAETFTVGTVVGGSGTNGLKPVLVRAMGPTLGAAPFSVPGILPDPLLDVFTGGANVAHNDNWSGLSSLSTISAQVAAFAFSDANSKDAALVYNADPVASPGGFTVQIKDNAGSPGLVLAEFYDTTPAPAFTTKTPRLINISVLKPIGPGLTAGFVVSGSGPLKVLIRAIGPSLNTLFGVPGAVADPKLDILDAGGKVIGTSDNWNGTPALSAAFAAVGAFPLDPASKDAALLATLPPGNYTVQVSPASGATGTALVEVYEVP